MFTFPVMTSFIQTGTLDEAIVDRCDTKVAVWTSLLPASKKDPLRKNGQVDEIMYELLFLGYTKCDADFLACTRFMAHMTTAVWVQFRVPQTSN